MANALNAIIVDDDPTFLRLLRRLLNSTFDVVAEASDGAEALRMLEGVEVDLIVTDLEMRGTDGMALIRELKRMRPHVYILVWTSQVGRSIERNVIEAGAAGLVSKLDPEALRHAVELAALKLSA